MDHVERALKALAKCANGAFDAEGARQDILYAIDNIQAATVKDAKQKYDDLARHLSEAMAICNWILTTPSADQPMLLALAQLSKKPLAPQTIRTGFEDEVTHLGLLATFSTMTNTYMKGVRSRKPRNLSRLVICAFGAWRKHANKGAHFSRSDQPPDGRDRARGPFVDFCGEIAAACCIKANPGGIAREITAMRKNRDIAVALSLPWKTLPELLRALTDWQSNL